MEVSIHSDLRLPPPSTLVPVHNLSILRNIYDKESVASANYADCIRMMDFKLGLSRLHALRHLLSLFLSFAATVVFASGTRVVRTFRGIFE